jgi:trans-aconitate 2-methyltransferase
MDEQAQIMPHEPEHMVYSWNADDYRRNSSAQQVFGRELIEKLALSCDERVLDLGCGDGRLTAEIAEHLPEGSVVGLDSSAEMIAVARESHPENRYPNLGFFVGDVRELSFCREFDVVFSNAALHWVRDHRPVLAGIRESLKDRGRVLLQMGGRGNASEILASVEELMESRRWKQYFRGFAFSYGFFGPEEYALWLKDAGFSARRVELIPKTAVYRNVSELEGWIRTTWLPYTSCVPEERRQEFIADLAAHYQKRHPPDSAGAITVGLVRLEVEAALCP